MVGWRCCNDKILNDPTEPTWMSDFGRSVSENVANVITEQTQNVKTQIEDAIRSSFTKESTEKGSLSESDSEKSGSDDFVVLESVDAEAKKTL